MSFSQRPHSKEKNSNSNKKKRWKAERGLTMEISIFFKTFPHLSQIDLMRLFGHFRVSVVLKRLGSS